MSVSTVLRLFVFYCYDLGLLFLDCWPAIVNIGCHHLLSVLSLWFIIFAIVIVVCFAAVLCDFEVLVSVPYVSTSIGFYQALSLFS